MSKHPPKSGVGKLLNVDEAVKLIMEKEDCDISMKKALVKAVKTGKVRVWLCRDGKLRYQYNPRNEEVTHKQATLEEA
jgi:hypothetical protein